jgi:cytochrome P450
MVSAIAIPFSDPELFRDPHPLLHEVRARAPVVWSEEMTAWVLLRYGDVRRALFDPDLASTAMNRRIERYSPEEQMTVGELRETVERWMGLPRIEDHRRYCTLLRPRFSASAVRAMEGGLIVRADRLLAAIVERGGGDVVEDFAVPYTIDVVCELCGLPRSRSMARTAAIGAARRVGDDRVPSRADRCAPP